MVRIYDDEYTGPRYTYGFRNRPYGLMCQPDGDILCSYRPDVRIPEKNVRWGTVDYPFPLTEDDLYRYELVDLNDSDYHSIKFRIDAGRPQGGYGNLKKWQHGTFNNPYSPLNGMPYVFMSDGGDFESHFLCGCAGFYSIENNGSEGYDHYCHKHQPEEEI